jgi:hypothetical protein
MNLTLLRLLISLCGAHHIDPFLAESIIKVESNWDNGVIGQANERGLFQINPTSFRNLSIDELRSPETNLKLGVEYLVGMKRHCSLQEKDSWIICFNRGLFGGSKVKNYHQDKYYKSVMQEYNKLIGGQL